MDLLDINYVYMPRIDPRFKEEYLDGQNNSILKYNYENLLIIRTGYSYHYNSRGTNILNGSPARNSFAVRLNLESAGNILYGISHLVNHRKVDVQYSFFKIA